MKRMIGQNFLINYQIVYILSQNFNCFIRLLYIMQYELCDYSCFQKIFVIIVIIILIFNTWDHFAAAAKSLQLCPTLCDPIDGSPSGSPIPGILQERTLEWVAISFSSAWKWKVKVKSLSRVWLLATARTAALPGSSVHGIFQARVLEWGAIAFSKITLICINFHAG